MRVFIIISIIIYNDYNIIQYIVVYTSFVVSHKKLFTICIVKIRRTLKS